MVELDLSQVDLRVVLRVLALYAYTLRGVVPAKDHELSVALGVGPEDLASEAVRLLLDPDKHLWKAEYGIPTTKSVLNLLRSVLRRDFLDLVREKASTTTVELGDPDKLEKAVVPSLTLDGLAAGLQGPEAQAYREQLRATHRAVVKGESELAELLEITLDPAGYGVDSDADTAALLGVSPKGVVNRRKRLVRALQAYWKSQGKPNA